MPLHSSRLRHAAAPSLYARPRGARGIIPLIMGALAVGSGIYKAVAGNQQKQRNKGYIQDSYEHASKRLGTQQGQIRQNTSESLVDRGLTQGGESPIHAALAARMAQAKGLPATQVPGQPHTLGAQLQADNETQFADERLDLEQQKNKAESENNAAYLNTLVGAGLGTAQGIASAIGAKQNLAGIADMGAGSGGVPVSGGVTAPDAASSAPIKAALTGIDNPANWFGGIHGGDPLNAEGSSWNRNATKSGTGLTNDLFHA